MIKPDGRSRATPGDRSTATLCCAYAPQSQQTGGSTSPWETVKEVRDGSVPPASRVFFWQAGHVPSGLGTTRVKQWGHSVIFICLNSTASVRVLSRPLPYKGHQRVAGSRRDRIRLSRPAHHAGRLDDILTAEAGYPHRLQLRIVDAGSWPSSTSSLVPGPAVQGDMPTEPKRSKGNRTPCHIADIDCVCRPDYRSCSQEAKSVQGIAVDFRRV